MLLALSLMLVTGVVWGAIGIIYGKVPASRTEFCTFYCIYELVFCILSWILLTPSRAPVHDLMILGLLMIPSMFSGLEGFLLLKKAMNCGKQGLAWCIAQSAVLLQFIGTLACFNEKSSICQWIGMAIMIVSLLLVGSSKKSTGVNGTQVNHGKFLMYSFGAFLFIGLGQFMQVITSNIGLSPSALSWRLPLLSTSGAILWFAISIPTHQFAPRTTWKIGALYGAVCMLGQFTFFWSLDTAKTINVSHIAFPIAIGVSIVLFSLYCAAIRHERFSVPGWIGIGTTIAGITLLSL